MPRRGASNEYPQHMFFMENWRKLSRDYHQILSLNLTLLLLNTTCPVLANSVDPDQLASSWSGSALFVIKYVNFYQKPGSSNLIGWKI